MTPDKALDLLTLLGRDFPADADVLRRELRLANNVELFSLLDDLRIRGIYTVRHWQKGRTDKLDKVSVAERSWKDAQALALKYSDAMEAQLLPVA